MGDEVPPLEGRLTFAIHRISAQLARITNPVFHRYDLDLDTARIVVILLGRGTMPIGELVDLMLLPQSTISHQIRRLEKRGLVSRARLPSDQRSIAISLTDKGKEVATVANGLSEQVHAIMLDELGEADHATVTRQLAQVLDRLAAFSPESEQ